MRKMLLLALAAVVACLAARCAVELIGRSVERTHRVNTIAEATGFSTGAVRFFLSSLEKLGIDLERYSDNILAECMRDGFKFKFTEEN